MDTGRHITINSLEWPADFLRPGLVGWMQSVYAEILEGMIVGFDEIDTSSSFGFGLLTQRPRDFAQIRTFKVWFFFKRDVQCGFVSLPWI